MRLIFFLNVVSFVFSIFLGVFAYIYRRSSSRFRRTPLNIIFISLCLMFALGAFANAFFVSSTSAAEARLWFLSFSFIWYITPSLFFLFCILLSGIHYTHWLLILLLPGVLLTVEQLLYPGAVLEAVTPVELGWHAAYNEGSPWHWLNVVNYSVFGFSAIFLLLTRGLLGEDELRRHKVRIVLLSFLPTFLGTYLSGFLLRYAGFQQFPPMLPIFIIFLVAGLGWAQFRYDLLSFSSYEVAERIIDSVYDAVVLCSLQGLVIETNLSRNGRDYKGSGIQELIPAAQHPSPAQWLQIHARDYSAPFECNFYFTPNRLSPASMTVRPVAVGHEPNGYIISAHDLSAEKDLAMEVDRRLSAAASLRSVEANFTRAFHASPAGMLILEQGSQILMDANQAAADILHCSISEIVGSRLMELGITIDEEVFSFFQRAIERDATVGPRHVKALRNDGSRLNCLISASPLLFGGKKAVLLILIDITESEQLRDELERAQKLESIGILAGGIAHDFNNIMTAILGNISLAKLSLKETDDMYEAVVR
ncbi:MAG: PAS domain-containing protein, partial [Termitinemataceae bacterium]